MSHAATAATVYHFTIDGSVVSVPIPPVGWSPLRATNQELTYYGFPARPANMNSVAGQQWTHDWSTGWFDRNPAMCQHTRLSNGPRQPGHDARVSPNLTCTDLTCSPNWSGILVNAHIPTIAGSTKPAADNPSPAEAYGHLNNVDELGNCSPNDAHSAWVGLGGNGTGPDYPLMQNGVDSGGPSGPPAGEEVAWWEMIAPAHHFDTAQVNIDNLNVTPDDVIAVRTMVGYTSDFSNLYVTFGFHDLSTGQIFNVPELTEMGTYPVSDFYNDSTETAEAIDERQTDLGTESYDKLRSYFRDYWSDAQAYSFGEDGQPADPVDMRNLSHEGINMTNEAETTELSRVNGDPTNTGDFYDDWLACGSVEKVPS